jgi:hypothetical protein
MVAIRSFLGSGSSSGFLSTLLLLAVYSRSRFVVGMGSI